MNIGVHVSFQIGVFHFLWMYTLGEIVGLYGSSIFSFFEKTVFHSERVSNSVVSDSLQPQCTVSCQAPLSMDFFSKDTGVV